MSICVVLHNFDNLERMGCAVEECGWPAYSIWRCPRCFQYFKQDLEDKLLPMDMTIQMNTAVEVEAKFICKEATIEVPLKFICHEEPVMVESHCSTEEEA